MVSWGAGAWLVGQAGGRLVCASEAVVVCQAKTEKEASMFEPAKGQLSM